MMAKNFPANRSLLLLLSGLKFAQTLPTQIFRWPTKFSAPRSLLRRLVGRKTRANHLESNQTQGFSPAAQNPPKQMQILFIAKQPPPTTPRRLRLGAEATGETQYGRAHQRRRWRRIVFTKPREAIQLSSNYSLAQTQLSYTCKAPLLEFSSNQLRKPTTAAALILSREYLVSLGARPFFRKATLSRTELN